jgi:hypothetical protein
VSIDSLKRLTSPHALLYPLLCGGTHYTPLKRQTFRDREARRAPKNQKRGCR